MVVDRHEACFQFLVGVQVPLKTRAQVLGQIRVDVRRHHPGHALGKEKTDQR